MSQKNTPVQDLCAGCQKPLELTSFVLIKAKGGRQQRMHLRCATNLVQSGTLPRPVTVTSRLPRFGGSHEL